MNEALGVLQNLWEDCPPWLKAIVLLVGGLLAAYLVRFLLGLVLRLIRFDRLNERIGAKDFLRKGGVDYTPSRLLSVMAFWAILIAAFVESSRILDLAFITAVFKRFSNVIPGMIAAALIAIVGWVVIGFIANFAITIARNAGFLHSALLGKAIRYLGILLVTIMAMEQIEVGAGIFGTLILISFGALALGLALAFGIGCKDIARDAVQKTLKSIRENGRANNKADFEG